MANESMAWSDHGFRTPPEWLMLEAGKAQHDSVASMICEGTGRYGIESALVADAVGMVSRGEIADQRRLPAAWRMAASGPAPHALADPDAWIENRVRFTF